MNSLILRTSKVYGFGQEDKNLVPLIFNHIFHNQPLTLTRPEIERSFIYIDDLAEAYIRLAEAQTVPAEVFNVGPAETTTLATLVSTIKKVTGKTPQVSYEGVERPREVNLNRVAISRMKNKLNWQPEIDLETGLKLYLEAGNHLQNRF